MWRPDYDHPLPLLPPHGHGPPRGVPHAPPHHPPHGPHRGIMRGYPGEAPPRHHPSYHHEITPHHGDPYRHRPMYRPPPPARYDYGYPPSYHPHYPPPPPPQVRSFYGEAAPRVSEEAGSALPMVGGGCTCKKSKCLKLYCQCFSSSTTCGPKCKCQACHNTTMNREDIEEARKVILERNPSAFELKVYPTQPSPPTSPSKSGCKCRRSFCLKKYCECFNHGAKCGGPCRCVNCRNQPDATGGPYVQAQAPVKSPRRVSDAVPAISVQPVVQAVHEEAMDRMAIMAAVAMTELLGRKRSYSDDHSKPSDLKKIKTAEEPDDHAVVSSSSSSNSSTPEPIRPSSSASPRASPRASPVTLTPFAGRYYPYSVSPTNFRPKAYEETTRLSGLPKSLSFRKICSKCGKTRGEHGELGFGHRCVYQDCGKCGAGVQMHVKLGIPMGILCTLSEKDGATPGAARSYERKIHDLAVRAELQQKLAAQRAKA